MEKAKTKFEFTPEFQLEILRYIIKDPQGIQALLQIKPSYMTLIEHGLVAEGLKKYYKLKKKIPSRSTLLQVISELLKSKDYVNLVTKDDFPNIKTILNNLYTQPLKDSEYIQERVWQFAAYVEMKKLNDSFDLTNFEQYSNYSKKVSQILQKSIPTKPDEPLYLIKNTVERQFRRQSEIDIIPSPYWQLNELTNAGGFPSASVLVLLDKPKARKTFFLINLAKGYLRMKKSVLYIDLENGKAQIMDRFVQASLNKTKQELYSGEYDKIEAKHTKKLARLGVEFVVQRMPALLTSTNHIRDLINDLAGQGINIRVLIIDYAAKMASTNNDREDFERISNVYIDIQNLAEELHLDCVWTANHITRQGAKHRTTKYDENDISGAISIIRNAQGIFGLNATPEEEADNIQRLELVVQRDGKPNGRALFRVDVDRQRAIEFTREERKNYNQIYADGLDEAITKKPKIDKKISNTGDI